MKHLFTCFLIFYLFVTGCSPKPVAPTTKPSGDSATKTFVNPIAEGADPWVIKKDGLYYFCGSTGSEIYVSKSEKLTKPGPKHIVWRAPSSGWNQSNIWAPELHFLNEKWYIYYAAGESGPPFIYQRAGVLESVTEDPIGKYMDKGRLYTGDSIQEPGSGKWAIDLNVFKLNSQLYAVWSGWEQNVSTDKTPQHLYIAKMSNPWTISSNRVKISSPVESWETGGPLDLNEGPTFLKHKDKAFIIYSSRESWLPAYRLGQLTLSDTLMNPLEVGNWKKNGPVFSGTKEVYGVGHASFTTSPDDTEYWILYHSKKSPDPGWNRDIRLQKFTWNEDNMPDFGIPVPAGVPIKVPSGEETK